MAKTLLRRSGWFLVYLLLTLLLYPPAGCAGLLAEVAFAGAVAAVTVRKRWDFWWAWG